MQDCRNPRIRRDLFSITFGANKAEAIIMSNQDMGLAAGLALEIECYNRTVTTADRREGVSAFNEKRKPKFIGS